MGALDRYAFRLSSSRATLISPLAVCVSGTLFGIAMIMIYVSANSYIIDSYSSYAASAMAAKTFLRSECGAMVPLFVDQMFDNLGFQYAGLLLALASCAIAPIPFIFYFHGEKIRMRSSRASHNKRKTDEHVRAESAGTIPEKAAR